MRTLRFVVDGQIIMQDPGCDFTNLVPGSNGYLQAEFLFSKDWDGYAKVAAFWSATGREYEPQVLKDGKTCMIPAEALVKRTFKVQIVGKKPGSYIKTNRVEVIQNGGKI
jgi:hypothetical protein